MKVQSSDVCLAVEPVLIIQIYVYTYFLTQLSCPSSLYFFWIPDLRGKLCVIPKDTSWKQEKKYQHDLDGRLGRVRFVRFCVSNRPPTGDGVTLTATQRHAIRANSSVHSSRMEHHQLRSLTSSSPDRCDLGSEILFHCERLGCLVMNRYFFFGGGNFKTKVTVVKIVKNKMDANVAGNCEWLARRGFWVGNIPRNPNYLLSFSVLEYVSGVKSHFLSFGVWMFRASWLLYNNFGLSPFPVVETL